MTSAVKATKPCSLCCRQLSLDQFYNGTGGRRHSYCKPCFLDRLKVLRAARKAGVKPDPIR